MVALLIAVFLADIRVGIVTGRCQIGCVNNNCTESGDCIEGCKADYDGVRCDKCMLCLAGMCSDTGVCTYGCIKGLHGALCDKACPATCIHCHRYFQGFNYCESCYKGYYGIACEMTCPQAHCNASRCYKTTSDIEVCTECTPGYYGTACLMACPSEHCINGLCNQLTGDCMYGCTEGYYGPRCNRQCLVHPCDISCDKGYFGYDCRTKCPTHCVQTSCHRVTGECKTGCVAGYHGTHCNNTCPIYCASCDRNFDTSNVCTLCNAGFYGTTCDYQCSHCKSNKCDKITGKCTSSCIEGYYDGLCNTSCPPHCVTCDRYFETTNICISCISGYYGPACQMQCSSQCRHNLCDKVTGYCLAYCHEGFHGFRCDRPCPMHCLACDREFDTTNTCTTCKQGFYGPACKRSCSENCRFKWCEKSMGYCSVGCQATDSSICVQCLNRTDTDCVTCPQQCVKYGCNSSVECANICNVGYTGKTCNDCAPGYFINGSECNKCPSNCESCTDMINCYMYVCQSGTFYGSNCQNPCSLTCIDQRCDGRNGTCISGCIIGYYGEMCETRCSKNCINHTCARHTGGCIKGCHPGFIENDCTNVLHGTRTATTEIAVGLSVGVVVIAALIVSIVCCVVRARRTKNPPVTYYLTPVGNEHELEADIAERHSLEATAEHIYTAIEDLTQRHMYSNDATTSTCTEDLTEGCVYMCNDDVTQGSRTCRQHQQQATGHGSEQENKTTEAEATFKEI